MLVSESIEILFVQAGKCEILQQDLERLQVDVAHEFLQIQIHERSPIKPSSPFLKRKLRWKRQQVRGKQILLWVTHLAEHEVVH